jgi:hypothetical protein
MTAAAKPGRREGGGTLDCRTRDLVLMEGGATRAAAVATWALVCARGDGLVGVAALRSRTICRFQMRSRLADSVGMFVGVTGVCTLGTDGFAIMERVILLLSSLLLVAGTFGGTCTLVTRDMLGVCTLGTCCMFWVVEDVATSARRSGCACTWAFCCLNDAVEVLGCLRISGVACHAL